MPCDGTDCRYKAKLDEMAPLLASRRMGGYEITGYECFLCGHKSEQGRHECKPDGRYEERLREHEAELPTRPSA